MANLNVVYFSDSNSKYLIRLSQDKLNLFGNNAGVGQTATIPLRAKVSRSAREYGIRPREITLNKVTLVTIGGSQVTATRYAVIPVVRRQDFDGVALGSQVTYKGQQWTVINKRGEDFT